MGIIADFQKIILILVVLAITGHSSVCAGQSEDESESHGKTADILSTATADKGNSSSEDNKKTKKIQDPNRGRFLTIPIFITEPAIGEGLGLALAYFHRKKADLEKQPIASMNTFGGVSKKQTPPPTVTGVMAAYTSNETAAVGIGHTNSFKGDKIRFTGVAALADVNSTLYLYDRPIKFNLKGALAYQETLFRFGDSRWFWGIGLSYLDVDQSFLVDLPDGTPIDITSSAVANSGLSANIAWDTRDNTSMPNRGQLVDLALWRYDEFIGSDSNYWDTRLKLLSFHQLHEKFVLGLRLEFSAIDGNTPFFAIPWVKLRGIPALRYQGDAVGAFEIEVRYNFKPKWALLAFAGAGKVSTFLPALNTEQEIHSYGMGGRYKVFEAQNIWVGIDIAKGPEEVNWYIQVGHAW